MEMSAWVLALVTFVSSGAFTWVVLARLFREKSASDALSDVLDVYVPRTGEPFVPTVAPFRPNLLDKIGHNLIPTRYANTMKSRLVSTGKQDISAYRNLVRRKVVGAFSGLAYGMVTQFDAGPRGVLMIAAFTLLGYFLPDVLTYNTGTKRSLEIDKTLPDAIDILNLCVESGLTFQSAMSQVASILKGPLAQEFARVLRQMQLGQTMIDSLQDMSDRNNNADLERFVSVLVQAERLGIPMAGVLREQSTEMRMKRRDRAREQAQKVPVKILMPVMLCFLPGIFIIILGPAVVSIIRAFSGL
ncbi:MAG: type II secretion system F family protein [Actinomycetes bacterium]